MTDSGIAKFVDLIRDLVKEEIDKTDSTIVCKVVNKNRIGTYDYRYDLCVEPDESNIISGIQNASNSDIGIGDYVYVYKVHNQLNNCFIFKKIGGSGSTSYISILEDKISTLVTSEDFSTSITQTAKEISLRVTGKEFKEYSAEIKLLMDQINAEVANKANKDGHDAEEKFGWHLDIDGFSLYSESGTVMEVDREGLSVHGNVQADTGSIGSFTIGTGIYHGIDHWDVQDDAPNTGDNCVYIGVDGIRLGKNFYVDPEGNVTANTLRTIDTVDIYYVVDIQGANPPGDSANWSKTFPSSIEDGYFLWTKTVTTYTYGSPDNAYSVSRKGEDGKSINVKVSAEECTQIGEGYIEQNESSAYYGHLMILTSLDPKQFTDGGEVKGPKGEDGSQGFGTVTSVSRPSVFTESLWATYGTIGHEEMWTDTSTIRNGCRIGDIFTVVGNATDTLNSHVLYYRSTTASGNLQGTCINHTIVNRGQQGQPGQNGTNGQDGKDGNGINNTIIEYVASDQGLNPPGSGWSTNIPTVNPGQYLWTRTILTYTDGTTSDPVYSIARNATNGTDATVTYDNVCSALGVSSAESGLIPGSTETNKYVLLNATAIKTGTLQVGSSNNIKFLATVDGEHDVQIAGFKVNALELYHLQNSTDSIGSSGSVFVSAGTISSVDIAGSGPVSRAWAFTSGNTFGVTTSGELFSTSGKIANINIESTALTKSSQVGDKKYNMSLNEKKLQFNLDVKTGAFSKGNSSTYIAIGADIGVVSNIFKRQLRTGEESYEEFELICGISSNTSKANLINCIWTTTYDNSSSASAKTLTYNLAGTTADGGLETIKKIYAVHIQAINDSGAVSTYSGCNINGTGTGFNAYIPAHKKVCITALCWTNRSNSME